MPRDRHPSSETSSSTRREFLTNGAVGAAAAAAALAGPVAAQAAAGSPSEEPPPKPTGEFRGQCAFVTGGARGIGNACAEALARAGADVVLYDVAAQIDTVKYPLATEADLTSAMSRIQALGVRCTAIQGDVRSSAQLKGAMARTIDEFGRLDILVVNAGITQVGMLDAFPDDEVQTVIDVNLGGAIKTVQAALPTMRKQSSGRIVMIASILGRMGNEAFPVYASTKWGVIGLAKSVALMMAEHNVMCHAVCPTWVRTGLADNPYVLGALSPDDPSFEAIAELAKAGNPIPIGFYEPEDVGRVVKVLCSRDTALLTGEVIDIAAGANARSNA